MSGIEFVQSSKSKTILVVDGYEYYKKREKLTTAWNCAQYQTLSCRTSAITSGEQLTSIRGNHNHDICLGKAGARKVSKKIKDTQRNWHCPLKPVSSKFFNEWGKKRIWSTSQTRQAETSTCLKNSIFLVNDTGKEDHDTIAFLRAMASCQYQIELYE